MKYWLFFIILNQIMCSSLYSKEEFILTSIIKNSYNENDVKNILNSSLDFYKPKKETKSKTKKIEKQLSKKTIAQFKQEIEKKSQKISNNNNIKYLSKVILDRIKKYNNIIKRKSKKYHLDESLVQAIIYVESAGKKNAISHKGAMGLMQIMPSTAATLGLRNPFNPIENIETGCNLLSLLKQFYKNDDFYVLWAYNAGINRVDKNILPEETKNYIIKVKKVQNLLNKG